MVNMQSSLSVRMVIMQSSLSVRMVNMQSSLSVRILVHLRIIRLPLHVSLSPHVYVNISVDSFLILITLLFFQ